MIIPNYPSEYLISILNAFKDLIFVFNSDGFILDYLQDESSELLYVPKEQFIGKNHRDVLPPDVSEKVDKAITEIKNGKNKFTFDYRLSIKGRAAWFTAVFSAIRDEFDFSPKYLCVIREITERKEKELLLQSVLQNAFNAFIVLRAVREKDNRIIDFQWIMLNHEAEKWVGKNANELVHNRISEFPDQKWILFEKYVQVVETGEILDLEYSLEKNHSTVWLHTHVTKLDDSLVITIKNITEKKQAELDIQAAIDQFKASRKQMDLFFQQALTGFFFMMLSEPIEWDKATDKEAALNYLIEHLHFTRVNDTLLQQYRATRDQFMALTPKDFFKRDKEKGRELLRKLYDEGRIYINRQSQRMDGSDLWLQGNYICFKENGKVWGHFGIQQDVTEHKHAEDLLQASEERYRLLADNMPQLVGLHEPDGTYTYVSPSVNKLLGYSPEELVGTNPYKLFHPDDIISIQQQSHNKALEGDEITDIEYRIQRKDGQYVWFSTSTKPIIDSAGKVTMLQTVSRDVTEKVMARQALEELNNQKNKLFSILAHDLRGPIANFVILLELAQKEVSVEGIQKYLVRAEKSANVLRDLMEELLIWTGSQLDRISFNPEILQLKREINKVAGHFFEIAKSKKITLNVDVSDDTLSVYADRDMVHTVIRNLISNAIKFTKPEGRIDVQTKRNNGWIEVSVSDNGIGIKKGDLEKLFSKTSISSTYGTNGEKGIGLGLDVCSEFVEKHKGKIWAESEPGKGSKFIFTLRDF